VPLKKPRVAEKKPGTMIQACNPSRKAETGESRVQGHPGLYMETVSKKNK
jgi:hypothetical protein